MATVKLYYDNFGRIKSIDHPPIYATSKKVDRIEAYTDFNSKDYEVSISFIRADGVMLGAYPMKPIQSEEGYIYHSYDLEELETRVSGSLQLTIRYERYDVDPLTGDTVLNLSKPVAMTEIYIYETVKDARDKLSQLLQEVKDLKEKIKVLDENTSIGLSNKINQLESRIKSLEENLGDIGEDVINSISNQISTLTNQITIIENQTNTQVDQINNIVLQIEQLVEVVENLPSTGFSNIIISREEPEDLPEGGLWLHIKN